MKSLDRKKILLGVSGGIAVYKACSLVNFFIKEGAEVRVVMTESASKFVSPLTFQTLSGYPVYKDLWESSESKTVEHISLSHWPDLVVVAPATANTIAKIALGIADNLLTTTLMAIKPETPVVLAPAMNSFMWLNPANQKNLSILKERNFFVLEPRVGILACREEGVGKISDPDQIFETVKKILLTGKNENKKFKR